MPAFGTGSKDVVFFYGSLMQGLGAAERLGIVSRLRSLGPGAIAGELYDLGDWPGLRPGQGRVVGELYAPQDDAVLPLLDSFEGFDPEHPADSIYRRERVPLLDGERLGPVWTYVFNEVPEPDRWIPHGDWRRYLAERGGRAPRS